MASRRLSAAEESEILAEHVLKNKPESWAFVLRSLDSFDKKRGLAVLVRLVQYVEAGKNGHYLATVLTRKLTDRVS